MLLQKHFVILHLLVEFALVIPYGELLIDVYVKCFGKSVNEVDINNPGLGKVNSAMFGNLFRENWLVQYSFFKYIKGHTG